LLTHILMDLNAIMRIEMQLEYFGGTESKMESFNVFNVVYHQRHINIPLYPDYFHTSDWYFSNE